MLELASVGARVLQTRSVELAMKENVRVQVLSSFKDAPEEGTGGSLVVDEDEIVEQEIVSGIAYSRDEAKITVRRVPDRPGVAAAIFGPLTDGQRQRGHDRAERVGGRHHGHDVHRRPGGLGVGAVHPEPRLAPRSAMPRC